LFFPELFREGSNLYAVDGVGAASGDTAVAGAGDFAVTGSGITECVVDLFFGGDFGISGVSSSSPSGSTVIGNEKANEWAERHVEDSEDALLADVMGGASDRERDQRGVGTHSMGAT